MFGVSIGKENTHSSTSHERWTESQQSDDFSLAFVRDLTSFLHSQFYRTMKHFDGINIQKL